MKKRRSTLLVIVATSLATALFVLVLPAAAGVGDALLLGKNNSGANKTTSATAKVDGPAFKFENTFGGKKAAARINTGCVGDKFDCAPPFATDSSARVLNFNSDYLDGLSADEISTIVASNATSDLFCDNCSLNTSISVPGPGWLVMSGGVNIYSGSTQADGNFNCNLSITPDGSTEQFIAGSFREWDGMGTDEQPACQTSGTYPVDAGTHVVRLDCNETANLGCEAASVQAVFHPDPDLSLPLAAEVTPGPIRQG